MASPQQPAAPPTNPFDGFDSYSTVVQPAQAQVHQPPAPSQAPPNNQWAQAQQQPVAVAVTQPAGNPFGAPASPSSAATAVPTQQYPTAPTAINPFGTAPAQLAQQPQVMVQPPAAAAPMAQQPQVSPPNQWGQQQQQQALVPMAPSAVVQSPWALGGVHQQQPPTQNQGALVAVAPAPGGQQTYDPLSIFGAPSSPPQQPQFQAQQEQQQQYQGQQQQLNPYVEQTQQFNVDEHRKQSVLPDEIEDAGLALVDVELDEDSIGEDPAKLEIHKKDGEYFGGTPRNHDDERRNTDSRRSSSAQPWDRNPDIAPPPPRTPGRHHSEYLAQNSAPALSSPLPNPSLVHHSGYVLSRISFRTVLMRKWKQTFWIQYGPTQLLFFRNFADYEDWMNNPYHTQKAREFLIKLRVDFVSDLKKSSVMGYQVTQVRRKPYGKNVMLHFKLERWMDYGPTIAAAFAAREEEMMNSPSHGRQDEDGMNSSNDVSSLRKIILGCMRNARDAASSALVSTGQNTDMAEPVAYQGRYDAEHERGGRAPANRSIASSNIGYHQAFSAESSERRAMPSYPSTEASEDEHETKNAVAPSAPVVDLLG